MPESCRFPAELHLVHVREDFVHENGTIDLAALSNPEGLSVLGIFIDIADNSTSPLYTAWFDVGRFSNI